MGNEKQVLKKDKDSKQDTKWNSLKARGITPPKDEEEARKRLKDAHGY